MRHLSHGTRAVSPFVHHPSHGNSSAAQSLWALTQRVVTMPMERQRSMECRLVKLLARTVGLTLSGC